MYPTGSIPGPLELKVKPHNLWTRFLLERVEVAKYCSPDQVEILVNLLCECLSLEIGGKERTCSRLAAWVVSILKWGGVSLLLEMHVCSAFCWLAMRIALQKILQIIGGGNFVSN